MIHPTAIIDPKAKLGANVSVGPYAIVEGGVEIGDGCALASHAILRCGTVLGKNVRVDSLSVIGGDPQHLKFDPATPSGVRIGDGTVLREGVTIHRATQANGFTEIGAGALLMGFSHAGHDCQVGARVIIANDVLLAGHVEVGDDTFLSGGAVFHQFIRIGEGVMVSGNARIGLDVPPFTIAAERNELHGLNLIGLRRRGTDAKTIAELKRLYLAVYKTPSAIKNAAAAAKAGLAKTDAGKKFLAFFDAGKRGFLQPAKSGTTENAEDTES